MPDTKISALSTGTPASTSLFAAVINSTTMAVKGSDLVLNAMTAGSLLLGAGGVACSLAIGSSGYVLESTGGTAAWVAKTGGGSTALGLTAGTAHLPFGSSVTAASVQMHTATEAADPKPRWTEIVFSTAAIEHIQWSFMAPANYASAPVVDVYFKPVGAAGAGTSTVEFGAYLAAVTPLDAADMDIKAFATVNWANSSALSSGYLYSVSITMANADSIAAGDMAILDVCRNGPGSTDTYPGSMEVPMVRFRYTAV